MKTLVSFCKLESDVLAKFTIRLKSQSEQYKAITLRNVEEKHKKTFRAPKSVAAIISA